MVAHLPWVAVTRYVVRPSGPLSGTVQVSGATKNLGCKLLAASLLTNGTSTIRNIPHVDDLDVMIELLRALGATVEPDGDDGLRIDASGEIVPDAPYEIVSKMRASFNVLGPLVARCGEARVAMPGGDSIGSRKLDMHIDGLRAMGARVEVDDGYVVAWSDGGLLGARHVLEFPSVGATENLLTAAVLAKGPTTIENAAREPEITELCRTLNMMGAHVVGGGTSTITVEGVEELSPVETELIGDRIEAGTFLMACAVAGGEIELVGTRLEHVEMVAHKLGRMGMLDSATPDGLWARKARRLDAVDVQTLPFPGFATDFMPLAVAALAVADGTAIVTENVYDGRFQFVDELARMGANVRNDGRHAIVRGVERLVAAEVQAADVRAGAALTIAALVADGETTIDACHHVDRGYANLPAKLRQLGADVDRRA